MPEDSIMRAFAFAYKVHKNGTRKGTDIPYIVHPMDVASTLLKNGCNEDLVVAGLLHDVVEDADVGLDEIEGLFGGEVARLVDGASEPEELRKQDTPDGKRASWKARKEHTISFITGADRAMKTLSCADKLSNVRDMIMEDEIEGERFWGKFNASRESQAWYYKAMVEAYSKGESISDLPVFSQFKACVEDFFSD